VTQVPRDAPIAASPWAPAGLVAALASRGAVQAIIEVRDGAVHETTAEALAQLVYGTAKALASAGVLRGDTVVLYAANGAHWPAVGLACGWLGAVLAPVDATASADEARGIAEGLAAKVVVTDVADGLAREVPEIAISKLAEAPREAAPPPVTLGPDDPIALFRTSGTTGPPKKFFLTLENIGTNVDAATRAGLVSSRDRVLMPLPMHHIFPWVVGTLVALNVGAAIVLPESPTGPESTTALRATRPSVLLGVPKLYEAMLDGIRRRLGRFLRSVLVGALWLRRISGLDIGPILFAPVRQAAAPGLRLMISGGARLDRRVSRMLETLGWDVRCGYGLSETAAMFTAELYEKRHGTEGSPVAGCEIRIGDPDESGIGEILLRGPNVFSGYLENPDENAHAFTPDGFFRSGDLGRVDRDGFLTVTGRAKEVIVLGGGKNIYPDDLERKYEAAPDIAEIGVFERQGKLLGLVVPDMTAIAQRGALRAEDAVKVALSSVAKSLPSTQRLSGFQLTPTALPRTRLGKLRRFLLPDLYDQAATGAASPKARELTEEESAWIAAEPRSSVWALLKSERARQSFGLDSHLELDLGFDSFGWMNLSLRIEEATGVRLDARDVAQISTVRELLESVTSNLNKTPADASEWHSRRIEEERIRWLSRRNWVERIIGGALLLIGAGLMRLLFRLKVNGAASLPTTGPLLICPNHISDLDPPAIAAALPRVLWARTSWAADTVRVFGVPVYRVLCRPLRVFPVDETAPLVAVELATEVLRRGEVQVWFPEGWRSADGRLLRFQAGIGLVLKATRAPVVPTFIEGALEAWPRERRFPQLSGHVRVTFGDPIAPEELAADGDLDTAAPEKLAEALRRRVADLARSRGADIL